MDTNQLIFIVFGAVIFIALILDLGLLSKKNAEISMKTAIIQTTFWVMLFSFFLCIHLV